MKKVKSTLLMVSLVLFFTLTAVGCAQHGSNTMEENSMDTSMDSMKEGKMDSDMGKSMDTMDAEKMDKSMEKNMQNNMK